MRYPYCTQQLLFSTISYLSFWHTFFTDFLSIFYTHFQILTFIIYQTLYRTISLMALPVVFCFTELRKRDLFDFQSTSV